MERPPLLISMASCPHRELDGRMDTSSWSFTVLKCGVAICMYAIHPLEGIELIKGLLSFMFGRSSSEAQFHGRTSPIHGWMAGWLERGANAI